jgi:hypothetical protein
MDGTAKVEKSRSCKIYSKCGALIDGTDFTTSNISDTNLTWDNSKNSGTFVYFNPYGLENHTFCRQIFPYVCKKAVALPNCNQTGDIFIHFKED